MLNSSIPIDLNPARLPGEKFEVYRARRRLGNKLIKAYCRGRMLWVSRVDSAPGKSGLPGMGTYVKSIYGKI